MKKLLLALLIVLTLSGCDRTSDFINNVAEVGSYDSEENFTVDIEGYYTQEEVDEIVRQALAEFENDEFQDLVDYVLQLEQEICDAFEDIESNDGYIENTYVNHNELGLYIQELDERRAIEYDIILKVLLDNTDIFEYEYENGMVKETNIINGTFEYHTAEEIITQALESSDEE